MRKWVVGLLLVGACGACRAEGDGGAEAVLASAPEAVQSAPACRVVLTPDATLGAPTERAATLWSAATGCDIEVGPGGVPIELWAHVWRPDGTDAPGATSPERDRVRINARASASQRERAVLHEVGHVLGADDIAGDGVMGGGEAIDQAALESVCATLPCVTFAPSAT